MEVQVKKQVDHLFRHEYGKITAVLTASFGSSYLDMVEDAVQEALLTAMRVWAFDKVPENPSAWVYRVARNKLLDELRKVSKLTDDSAFEQEAHAFEALSEGEIEDEQLKMIFACCHPKLTQREQLLLSLKLIGGFSVVEIARALLLKEEAAKKSVLRAKKRFREEVKQVEIPVGKGLEVSLSSVLTVIYLMFNEGYKTSEGETLIKEDLCGEALRLALTLSRHPNGKKSEVFALIALISFKIARFKTRTNQFGELILLEEQDRMLWNKEYIGWGFYYFNTAVSLGGQHIWLLEAGIEYQYHIAPGFAAIDWRRILLLYNKLLQFRNSALVRLNRLVVLAKVEGPEVALNELVALQGVLEKHHMYYAIAASFHEQMGDYSAAQAHWKQAAVLATNSLEKKFLEQRYQKLKSTNA